MKINNLIFLGVIALVMLTISGCMSYSYDRIRPIETASANTDLRYSVLDMRTSYASSENTPTRIAFNGGVFPDRMLQALQDSGYFSSVEKAADTNGYSIEINAFFHEASNKGKSSIFDSFAILTLTLVPMPVYQELITRVQLKKDGQLIDDFEVKHLAKMGLSVWPHMLLLQKTTTGYEEDMSTNVVNEIIARIEQDRKNN